MKRNVISAELEAYILGVHSGSDDSLFRELREATAQFGEDAIMQIPDHQGTFLTLITKILGARTALEIGTFTGHSSISIARGLPEDGSLLCLDMSREWTNVARTFWERAGLTGKVELRIGDALETISEFDSSMKFDLVHIDAEKTLYDRFFEAAFPYVRSGGVFLFDNMLRHGRVLEPQSDERTEAIKTLNQKLAGDPRIETVLIEMGDGIQMCRKK
ncbi:MAG: class I SAM-dependent methyltransferase [Planctomycetota bacterium]